jgi:pilus assembly protein Flp/PilA
MMLDRWLRLAGWLAVGPRGQGLVEYALIMLLVAIAVIGALSMVGTNLSAAFSSIDAAFP